MLIELDQDDLCHAVADYVRDCMKRVADNDFRRPFVIDRDTVEFGRRGRTVVARIIVKETATAGD